jgi:hypothetical protein
MEIEQEWERAKAYDVGDFGDVRLKNGVRRCFSA